jgi:hypothetical protein
MMHFHTVAKCRRCTRYAEFTTPIPERVILNHQCNGCGAFEMVGIKDGGPCLACLETLLLDWDEISV